MGEIGYSMAEHRSRSIEEFRGRPFDVVVTPGCGDRCRGVDSPRVVDWPVPDPKGLGPEGFRRVRDRLAELVESLFLAD